MQVVTLNQEELDAHAARLAKAVAEGSDTRYDAIVAIKRGGSFVCDAFLRHFPRERYVERHDITHQRPSTKHKGEKLKKVLTALPYPVLDALRIAESWLLQLRKKTKGGEGATVEIPKELAEVVRMKTKPEILVIDDAIDSGDTLTDITETLRTMNPEARISIAVMTETTSNPRVRSNYTLYRNRTLIRFPWANDYKSH